ncbi:MAG: MFS transporter [Leptospiraceae bacterium]|nr:MFS transporter [Leptospiraceae bacterium]MCZ8346715.1 MFS transporter [Leptospiraceae bacterium]
MSQLSKTTQKKQIFGWCMFDFANSSYTTVIITVIFCNIFTKLIVPSEPGTENPYSLGNLLWSIAQAVGYLLVVISAPIIGAITDFSPTKKKALILTSFMCIVPTALLYFIEPGMVALAMILVILSFFSFTSTENIVSSFLPFLGDKNELGKISGYAWGIGYFGGLGSVALVQTLGDIDITNYENLKWVGPYTAIFFLIAAIPTFLFLKEPEVKSVLPPGVTYIKHATFVVIRTLKDAAKFKDLMIYLFSLFFAMASHGIVIGFAFIYGEQEIGLSPSQVAFMFIFLQISAALGAFAFGLLQDSYGAKKTFNLTLYLWIFTCSLIYFVKDISVIAIDNLGLNWTPQWIFIVIAVLAGLGIGSTQSASRAIVGLFSPATKTGEFYGLWGLSGKVAAAVGLLALGGLQTIFTLRNSFLIVALFYFLSLVVNFFVDEKRGIAQANNHVN